MDGQICAGRRRASPPASWLLFLQCRLLRRMILSFAKREVLLDEFANCESNSSEALLHVISRKKLLEAAEVHAELAAPLDVWYRIARKARCSNLLEVRQVIPSAHAVGK